MFIKLETAKQEFKMRLGFKAIKMYDKQNAKPLINAIGDMEDNFSFDFISKVFFVALKVVDKDMTQDKVDDILDDVVEDKGFEYLQTKMVELIEHAFGGDGVTGK